MTQQPAATPQRIVIATRESELALWQAHHVQAQLQQRYPQLEVSILGMTTTGDQRLETTLAKIGGKGLFVKELEEALADGRADVAVHSMKDVPMHMPPGFMLAAVLARADPRDALVGAVSDLAQLPPGARVGTSSLRRESQLRAHYPHLQIVPLRGNVQTRLRKLDAGEYQAIILAAAGLQRLGLTARISAYLTIEQSLPAVGQGALGIECSAERADVVELFGPFVDPITTQCVLAERALSRALAGNCSVPLAGFAELVGERLRLRGLVGAPDGRVMMRAECFGASDDPEALGAAVAAELRAQGAAELLAALDATT